MFGISWGGFNSIQIAARRPSGLKAIIAIEATEDLFHDDVHFIDGLFHFDQYELGMDLQPAITPAPNFPLDEDILGPRFDNPPWSLLYKKHQRNGPFWTRASLAHRYGDLQVPALLIAGWLDGYRDSVPRMLERCSAPIKAIVGPWNHSFPHDAVPGPCIEWRAEAVRWWDHWLKGLETGVMDEPRLAVYVRHYHPPGLDLQEIPGEWRTEEGWPMPRMRPTVLHLQSGGGLGEVQAEAVDHLKYVPSAGTVVGFWWGDLTPDQRPADAFSLVYETASLESDVEILGFPRVLLNASSTAPLAHWFARLSDAAPDGVVTQVTGAGLNGAHLGSAENPKPLDPGRIYRLELDLHFTSWVFPKGHRIRLALSNAAWPMVWPTPYPMTTALHLGGHDASRIVLPVIPHEERPKPNFRAPDASEFLPGIQSHHAAWPGRWVTRRNEAERSTEVEWNGNSSAEFPWGRQVHSEHLQFDVQDDRPEEASMKGEAETQVHLPGRVLAWRVSVEIRSDATSFRYRCTRELFRDGLPLRRRTWEEMIDRDHQ
jgi:hypothetical protein